MSPQELATQECGTALCLSVYVITFVLGFPANVLAFYTFCSKVRQKATPIDILLLNLTISDLLFLLFLPFKMQEVVNNMRWDMPYPLCPLSGFIFYMTIYNSTFFLTAVSVERYLGVAFPIQHSLKRRPLYAVAASVFFWIFSFSHLSIVFIMPFIGTEDEPVTTTVEPHTAATTHDTVTTHNVDTPHPGPKEVCYDNFSDAQLKVLLPVRLELCLVLFCIPFLICSYCYINFIRILSRLQHIDRRRRLRAIGMALGTLVVFAVCFGPYNVSHVVGFITWKNPQWRDKALLCSTFNACLDPLIFYFSSSAVRGTVGSVTGVLKARLSGCLSCRAPKQSVDDKDSKQEQINAI
ncbi:free fatty acid receptor 2-like [Corythoichthys intestinalis]|uniref:free fatty acid receptor 2-like n=1 Tax=Corythoichthys intestinalis TaxID=161448 RepID=UPI0025A4D421|nr:free fatty acid receptor 2-like [Corythoichthys intestinalis]XP_061789464.1 free fatty acid receptor 2-like [Nerophis lumbriciformis]